MSYADQSASCRFFGNQWGSSPCLTSYKKTQDVFSELTIKIDCALPVSALNDWDCLAGDQPTLNRYYLNTLISEDDQESLYWVRFYGHRELVGIASFSLVYFSGPSVADHVSQSPVLSGCLKVIRVGLTPMRGWVLVCGQASQIGSPGYRFKSGHNQKTISPSTIAYHLKNAAEQLVASPIMQREISAVIFSDDSVLESLTKVGYTRFEVEPKLHLPISPEWHHIDDYLQTLISKYRVKVKRGYSKSSALNEKLLTPQQITDHQNRLNELYQQVIDRASLRLTTPEIRSLAALAKALPEEVKVYAYQHNHRLIGFRVSLISADSLIAHLVGIDYEYNRQYGLYPRMLNDYLTEAISLGVQNLELGRTASEIKTTLGAIPHPSGILVYHRSSLLNRCLPLISSRRSLPKFKRHQPFKRT